MSTSKHIDAVCVVVLLFTLLVTGLFMNGRALGIAAVTDGDAGDGRFTANDLNADWDRAGATQIALTGDGGSVKGSGAYIRDGSVHIVYAGRYVLSGELSNGSVIIDAEAGGKIWLLLDGVSLHCDGSAALLVEQADKVFLTLADGSSNVISSGAEYTAETASGGIDGAVYSRDDLTINGGGALRVTAAYKHGIVCNDDLVIAGGSIEITAARDGIHANDSARFANAELTINAGDDGITVSNDDGTAYVYVESGHISIPSCYEGIEAIDVTIAGGVIDIRPTDDGINATGRGGDSAIRVTGGDITIVNETGRDADGLDSNGSIHISGGRIFISVNTSSCALDCGTENGGVCEISGGTVIAAGGSAMAEGFDSSSEQSFIMYTTPATDPGTVVTLKNSAGDTLVSETIPCGFSSVILSTPELRLGETCTISVGGRSAEITVDNSSGSGGFGMGGMFGGGMRQGGLTGGAFGGRGGGGSRFPGNQQGTDDGDAADDGSQDMPQMPGGGFAPGGMPQRPGEALPDGEVPQLPEGDFRGGEMPQAPGGDFRDDELPRLPDGDMPQASGGGLADDGTPQMGDDGFTGGGNRRGGDRFAQGGETWDRTQGVAQGEVSAVPPEALVPVGVSALLLLAGILFAIKVRH